MDQSAVQMLANQLSSFIHTLNNNLFHSHFSAQVCIQAQALEIQQLHAHLHHCICEYSSLFHRFSVLQDECVWKDETNHLLLDDLMKTRDELQTLKMDNSQLSCSLKPPLVDVDSQTEFDDYLELKKENSVLEEKCKKLKTLFEDCQQSCIILQDKLQACEDDLIDREVEVEKLQDELFTVKAKLHVAEVNVRCEKAVYQDLLDEMRNGGTCLSQESSSENLDLELPSTPTNSKDFDWLLSPAPSLDTSDR